MSYFKAPPNTHDLLTTRYCVLVGIGKQDAVGYELYSFIEGEKHFTVLTAPVDNLRASFSCYNPEVD